MAINWDAISEEDNMRAGLCMWLDAGDFFLGWIPVFGFCYDLMVASLVYKWWGKYGAAWELADVTEIADAFVPSATICAFRALAKKYPVGQNAIDVEVVER